jgi:hypothetical protein
MRCALCWCWRSALLSSFRRARPVWRSVFADVAALLELKPYTVKEYARRGILPGRKLGRTWRLIRPELEDAIRRLPRPSN